MVKDVSKMSYDELDEILQYTEYADQGVAVGDEAAADQDMRRSVQRELQRRAFGD